MTEATSQPRVIDVRTIEPNMRHAIIFGTFNDLPLGDSFELINDHDPMPLYYQFTAQLSGRFRWDYLEHGPEIWRVEISKIGKGGQMA